MKHAPRTILEALQGSFAATLRRGEGVPPVAILWTDTEGQWSALIPALRAAMLELYTLGAYQPEEKTGPAIWLRCIVDRTLPEAPPEGKTPVLYLPKISRQLLRSPGECPSHLQPLIELQYRGQIWHQPNGNDWTVRAFLVSNDGLGLDVAGDRRTEEAFLQVLDALAEHDLSALRGRRLDSDDFYKIRVDDPVRDVLRWIDDPQRFEATGKGSKWESFRGLCRHEFAFDPEGVPPTEIAGRLVQAEPRLETVWQRFAEAPQLYRGVAKAMRDPSVAGQGRLTLHSDRNPAINELEEAELRLALQSCSELPHAEACARVGQLEAQHGVRRDWVWARTDMSPWAAVLKPLSQLAAAAGIAMPGSSLTGMVDAYAESGWQCDRAAVEALAFFTRAADSALVGAVVRSLYLPWLDASARAFQQFALAGLASAGSPSNPEPDTCTLFVDGLRFDLGMMLAEQLENRSLRVRMTYRLAPAPTVTATAKPVAAPPIDGLGGGSGDDFTPSIDWKGAKRPLKTDLFKTALSERGVFVFGGNEMVIPSGADATGWTECGSIDRRGHELQGELAYQIAGQLQNIAERVAALLDCGWQQVRVVTDHGWLLVPEALPKVELPHYLVQTKWARCAVVKGDPDLAFPVVPWYWNTAVRIASPPGAASFWAGDCYAHGGLSLQECVVPELRIEKGSATVHASIAAIEWRGMRCRVRVEASAPGLKVDIRTVWKQADTSIVQSAKIVGTNGEASVVVSDDSHEGKAAFVIVLDKDGNVVANKTTSVGENE